jgi:hypothetical protein
MTAGTRNPAAKNYASETSARASFCDVSAQDLHAGRRPRAGRRVEDISEQEERAGQDERGAPESVAPQLNPERRHEPAAW